METSKELTLTTHDLSAVGINSQLTSNDLLEVIAHDIYDKYMESVRNVMAEAGQLSIAYYALLNPELNKMRTALKQYFPATEKLSSPSNDDSDYGDDDDDETDNTLKELTCSFGKIGEYWPSIPVHTIRITERDKGTVCDLNNSNYALPNLKARTAKVELSISSGRRSDVQPAKVGNITGTVETSVTKSFKQVLTIPITRFKEFQTKVMAHNKRVDELMSFLPKNGALSVERFTREARVKLNKKIISNQSAEFRKKISELFNIKL